MLAPFFKPQETGGGTADGRQWVFFDSRETKNRPKLVFIDKSGKEREVEVAADSVLISYLGDRVWGSLPRLSLSLGDTNRVLLRFPGGAARFSDGSKSLRSRNLRRWLN